MLKKNDPAMKSEVKLPTFTLGAQKNLLKKPANDTRRVSNMDMLKD